MQREAADESKELKREWDMIAGALPGISLTPRTLVYMAIGWALVALFFVWMPIVFAYAFALGLWHLGRLFMGAALRAAEIIQGPRNKPTERGTVDNGESQTP